MKKLFSLLLVLALALVPTLSLADDDAACQNLYNMLLDELKSVDLEMTADEESYRIYLGYALDKNSLGDADVIFDAYSDAVTINVSYSNPLDEALVPQVISFFNRVNSTLYVGKLMVIKSDNVWGTRFSSLLTRRTSPIGIATTCWHTRRWRWTRWRKWWTTSPRLQTANRQTTCSPCGRRISARCNPQNAKRQESQRISAFFDTDYSSALRFSVQKSAITLSIVSASAFASMPAASQ